MFVHIARYIASSLRYNARTLTRISTHHPNWSLSPPICAAAQIASIRFISETALQHGAASHLDVVTDATENSSQQKLEANWIPSSEISESDRQAFESEIDDNHGTYNILL